MMGAVARKGTSWLTNPNSDLTSTVIGGLVRFPTNVKADELYLPAVEHELLRFEGDTYHGTPLQEVVQPLHVLHKVHILDRGLAREADVAGSCPQTGERYSGEVPYASPTLQKRRPETKHGHEFGAGDTPLLPCPRPPSL
ncbi:hypothetical protein E2C01_058690 [Portunus trituberculatus]|uniref:Uncharacterized protein n=1 Tax=Portunus trituberculatus TaxID=210409 RepID=A0A5B7H0I2_PORTR|nr:hypothetical protein [Portunus trituberculatus]